ncbi:diheme cytochrome c [Zwartia sp.]|uniref:diheme cytochrome c n=1 Tax=Zwartia sp. TaxID=2978004 RepID=UPI003BB1E7E0
MKIRNFYLYFLGLILSASLQSTAFAGSVNLLPATVSPKYQQECAACHLAYPPGLLPRRSWIRLMNNLESHFGSDASIDLKEVQEISVWLDANAGTYKRVRAEPKDDRLTESDWFVRKHRKIEAEVWLRDSVKSKANCAACHTQAERGNYDDDAVMIPK